LNIEASEIDGVLSTLGIDARPVDFNQGLLARRAFLQYGRGRHSARLNFGDCFPYALAKARGDTLLFKGEDFSKTDIIPAWKP
jgi:ribonuclease VapC